MLPCTPKPTVVLLSRTLAYSKLLTPHWLKARLDPEILLSKDWWAIFSMTHRPLKNNLKCEGGFKPPEHPPPWIQPCKGWGMPCWRVLKLRLRSRSSQWCEKGHPLPLRGRGEWEEGRGEGGRGREGEGEREREGWTPIHTSCGFSTGPSSH